MFRIEQFDRQQQDLLLQRGRLVHQIEAETNSEKSPYVYAYSAWTASVSESAAQALEITPAQLRQSGITGTVFEHILKPSNAYRSAVVTVQSMENRGAVVTYNVTVGAYVVKVRLLNVQDEARARIYERVINSGAFGNIILCSTPEYQFVSKRFLFAQAIKLSQKASSTDKWIINANFSELETVLQEFALAKICSFFKVGPKILTPHGFDVICYRNCVEFCMERCFHWSFGSDEENPMREERLKHCMRVMHLLRIVHRDIKPGNIVFSPSLGNLVLCDFGISHPVAEQIGFKTKTVQSGTRSYMSHEMSSLSAVTPGYVDLFYNDMHCLQVSVKVMELQRPEIQMFLQVAQNPLCGVFTTLYRIWAHQPVHPSEYQQVHCYIKQFVPYFPQVKGLFETGRSLQYSEQPTSKCLDISFVASSLPFDAKIHYYLQLCDHEDPKIDAILRWINQRQLDPVYEWPEQQLNTERNWRISERQLNVLKSELKSLSSKQQMRAIHLARNLFLLHVRKGERREECESLLEFIQQHKGLKGPTVERLMLIFAFEQPSFGEMDEVRAASASWSMETLNVFSEIAERRGRGMHKLREYLLRRLVGMCMSFSHYKLIEYSTRLNELEMQLYGYNRYSEHLARYFAVANSKSPAEWDNNDFHCLGLVIAEGSIKRARVLVEKLLPHAPKYRHPTLLFWLGKCYLSESRYGESIKCLQMSVAMMQDNPRYWMDRLLAMRFLALSHAYIRNFHTCLQILSTIKISTARLDSGAYIQVRIEMFLTQARVYSCQGNFENMVESLDNARGLLNPLSKDFSSQSKLVWLSVFYEYLELLRYEHPKLLRLRIVEKGLSELEKYDRLDVHINLLDKQIIKLVMELKGTCLLTKGQYAFAYEHLRQAERLSSEIVEANPASIYQLYQKLIRCEWKLQEFQNMQARRKSLKEHRSNDLEGQGEQEGNKAFKLEVVQAEMSLLLKNDYELQDLISKIRENFEEANDPVDSQKILRNLIEYAQEGNRYDVLLGIRKSELKIWLRPETEFAVGLCLHHLNITGECIDALRRMLGSAPKQSNLWLYACSYQLIYKSLECEGKKEQANSYRKREFQCLQELTRVEVTNIEAHYRLAVCLFRDGLVKQAKQRLLMSAVMSLQRQSVDNSLAVDCYKIFVRRKPRLVTRLLQECSERTPQVLHYLCRSYLKLNKERKFYSTVNELIRTKSEEVNLLCEYLVKQGKHIEKELLLGQTAMKSTVETFQRQESTILEDTSLKRMRRCKLCRDRGIGLLTKKQRSKGYDA